MKCDNCNNDTLDGTLLGNGVFHDECSHCGAKQHRVFVVFTEKDRPLPAAAPRVRIEQCNCTKK